MDTMIMNTDWLKLIDDMMDQFNESVAYWAEDVEMSDLWFMCIRELEAIKNSPIMLRDEDYYELGLMYHTIQKDQGWEQVMTEVLTPLKRITDHIKEDLSDF